MVALSSPTWGLSIEEIFLWVKNEYGCEKNYLMPEVQFVSKEKLQKIYRRCNEKTFKKWTGQFGTQKANEIMRAEYGTDSLFYLWFGLKPKGCN